MTSSSPSLRQTFRGCEPGGSVSAPPNLASHCITTIKSPTGPSFFPVGSTLSAGWVQQSYLRRCTKQRACKRDALGSGTKFRWSRLS